MRRDDDDPWFVITPLGPVPATRQGWLIALAVVLASTALGLLVGQTYPGHHGLGGR
jgi:hypothetical protein